jgi:hypothetical protein
MELKKDKNHLVRGFYIKILPLGGLLWYQKYILLMLGLKDMTISTVL